MNENVFPMRMKLLIENMGITQREISKMTGITEASVCKYLQGVRKPNAHSLIAIAKATNVRIDWLLGHGSDDVIERM